MAANDSTSDTTRTAPFSMRLGTSERERLDHWAARLGQTKTDLARQLIVEGLSRLDVEERGEVAPEEARRALREILEVLGRHGLTR